MHPQDSAGSVRYVKDIRTRAISIVAPGEPCCGEKLIVNG